MNQYPFTFNTLNPSQIYQLWPIQSQSLPSLQSSQLQLIKPLQNLLLYRNQQLQYQQHIQQLIQLNAMKRNYNAGYNSLGHDPNPKTLFNNPLLMKYECLDGIKTEASSSCKIERIEEFSDIIFKKEEDSISCLNTDLKSQIMKMLAFMINRYGKATEEQIKQQKSLYRSNKVLGDLFDALIEKYSSAGKCREDMVRFVLRRALSFLRDSLRNGQNLSSKAASIALCKRYFQVSPEEMMAKSEFGGDYEEDFLNFLLPYKKNSRNKTANTRFMTEIFASEIFYHDYKEYLKNLDNILEFDNKRKIERFVECLEDCVKRDTLHEIKRYKRLPWLKSWLETTKIIAFELLETNTWKAQNKENSQMKKFKAEKIEENALNVIKRE